MDEYTYDNEIVQIGPHWDGVKGMKNLVVFGASYCDVGYNHKTSPNPSAEEPLGVAFPGDTWAEPGKANWVGHLVTAMKASGVSILVYDFAVGGDTVDGVAQQIEQRFIPFLVPTEDSTPAQDSKSDTDSNLSHGIERKWTADDSLFAIWVGINDTAFLKMHEISPRVSHLFELVEKLYVTGARNFMLIDIPPMKRAPAMRREVEGKHPYEEWNELLLSKGREFAKSHENATVLIYSSWATFTRLLDNPVAHGLQAGHQQQEGGTIWYDHIHPTTKVHSVVAQDIKEFLRTSVP